MTTYVMTCGCEVTVDKLIKKPRVGYRCSKHPEYGKIDYIIKQCVDCSAVMTLNKRQIKKERCAICLIEHKKKIQKEINTRREQQRFAASLEKARKKQEKIQAAAAAWNCIHRNECLMKAPINSKFLPCQTCERYKAKDF